MEEINTLVKFKRAVVGLSPLPVSVSRVNEPLSWPKLEVITK